MKHSAEHFKSSKERNEQLVIKIEKLLENRQPVLVISLDQREGRVDIFSNIPQEQHAAILDRVLSRMKGM